MRINHKILMIVLAGLLIAPQLTFAAWWNPFTWSIFSHVKAPKAQVQKVTPPAVAAPAKPTVLANGQSKSIIKAIAPVKLSNAQIIAKIKPATVYIATDNLEDMIRTGSGIIISTDGYVLTNAHVVQGAASVKVSLSTGEIVNGTVVGRDEVVDLALIKLDTAEQLSKVNFGDSDKTQQGDAVFAFGFPFGIEGDVSFKDGTISRRIDKYFETSAEVHPGNSGGPLVNQYGQVIGINTAIFGKSVSGVLLGETIKLAIPINDAKNLITELKAGRNVVVAAEPIQPERQTYQILSPRDISNLPPGLQAVETAAYNEFLQTPDLQYLTPQQQNELYNQIDLRRTSEYEAQLRQQAQESKNESDLFNQLIAPQIAQPSRIPFEFDVQLAADSSNHKVRFSIISKPFYHCDLYINQDRYVPNEGIEFDPISDGNTVVSGYLDNGVYKYEIDCIGRSTDNYDDNITKRTGSFRIPFP